MLHNLGQEVTIFGELTYEFSRVRLRMFLEAMKRVVDSYFHALQLFRDSEKDHSLFREQ